ncbi:NYN domain-containing protein [Alteromonas sp.]|jgi:uncharacterized LabA/DUF88 family protein|nr:NYN domain-containing protein [Alteromonas sp.]
MNKLLILVDVQNVYYTCRQKHRKNFNYNAFWQQATKGKTVNNAFAYAIDKGDQKQKEFQNILRAIGFTVKLKPYIQRADGSAKGDWDVGITVDALQHAADVDEVILLSGDGDFDILVNALKAMGKTVTVYGVEALTANSLISAASQFIPIEETLLI